MSSGKMSAEMIRFKILNAVLGTKEVEIPQIKFNKFNRQYRK